MRARLSIPILLLAAFAHPAGAHEFWLAPSSYRAAKGDTVAIACFVGTGFRGERRPYATPRTERFALRGPRELDLRPATVNGDITWARFVVADGGGVLASYLSNFTPIELAAPEFDAYLELEGLDGPRAARAALGAAAPAGRERYARCPKTWIPGTDVKRVTVPVGLPLEVVPLGDPTTSPDVRVRILLRGRPLPHALVRAWRSPLAHGLVPQDAAARDSVGPSAAARTDQDGVARLRLAGAGEWLVSSVHMEPSEDRAAADWQSLWASLTFARARTAR